MIRTSLGAALIVATSTAMAAEALLPLSGATYGSPVACYRYIHAGTVGVQMDKPLLGEPETDDDYMVINETGLVSLESGCDIAGVAGNVALLECWVEGEMHPTIATFSGITPGSLTVSMDGAWTGEYHLKACQ